MEHRLKKWIRHGTAMLLTLLTASALVPSALAEAEKSRVLRVPFPQVAGITETTADGRRQGLVVDYLNEISKYTGWEYEYIDTDGDSMIDEFLDGKYDIMGGNYYSPGFEQYFAYPDFNIGYSKSVLMARKDDDSVNGYDLRSLNGKTIGVYERAAENIRRLKEYLSMNSLDCKIHTYSFEQLTEDGKLYPYLENGDIDLLLGNGFENPPNFRVVASFNSQPYYIVTNVGNQKILDGLNMALAKIADSNPNFSTERYEAYFQDQSTIDIHLSEAEQNYIQNRGDVTVAVPEDYHPLFCLNTPTDLHDGVVPDILARISEFTGLTFTYVSVDSYSNAIRMVQEGRAELLGFYMGTEEESIQQELTLTSPYVDINNIVVRNKASTYPNEGLVCAVVAGRPLPAEIQADEVRTYPTATDTLVAVNRGEADFTYGLASRLELDIQRYHFSNLVPVSLVNDRSSIGFALQRPADPDLLTILNKAINSLSSSDRSTILDRNLVSIGTSQISLMEFLYADPVAFVSVLTLTLLVLAAAVLLIYRSRMRAAVMQSDLEKAEARSRAKGEFLSRMSHELRTPMNAVVGLTDLTSMMEGVPADVRENLIKLRASSHYMLDLINDILDMSRIDSGKLSLDSEPFSLERMLGEIQAMMESEAQRQGITYILKKEITHSSLTGDPVRLRQVLTNLLSNALKFTPAGGLVLLRVAERAGTGVEARFTFQVRDTGEGITPEDQNRIFESFEQVGTNRSKSQGTGLGLAISSNIVQKMGGELRVKSEPGQGSEFFFTITLPLCDPALVAGQDEQPEEMLLDGVNILMAEDNDLNAEIAAQLLEIQGATVSRSVNGRQVIERFSESRPGEFQVILMDIQMPEMNGLEAARTIRSLDRPDAATVPIVAMTANTFREDVDAAMEAGMNGFVPKPLDVNFLYNLLHDLLQDKTSQ